LRRGYRLLHVTDTHLFEDPDARLRGVDTASTLARVVGSARADPRRPDAVLATGDLSQDETAATYARFRAILTPLAVPVWCVPGNHDAPPGIDRALATAPFHVGGSFVAGRWSIILLSSFAAGDHGGRLGDEQLAWLAATLRAHHDRHVLVALHHHVLPLGSRWLDEFGLRDADALLAAIGAAPHVRAVLAGHVHQASDLMRNGVRYLTTPSTCFQFLPQSDAFALDVRPPGYRWLDLMPDGSIATEVTWIDTDD
jgi:Icc protein